MTEAPTLMSFFESDGGGQVFNLLSGSIGKLSENFVLILIYIAFLYTARPTWEKKFDAIFRKPLQVEQLHYQKSLQFSILYTNCMHYIPKYKFKTLRHSFCKDSYFLVLVFCNKKRRIINGHSSEDYREDN